MQKQEKEIYNTFLRITRTQNNKPFQYRKNFDNFESHTDYPFIQKLSRFFKKFPHIRIEEFMVAPYKVYPDAAQYYDIKFYTTPKAIKLYSLYMDNMAAQSPDNDQHIEQIKESMFFIFKFCRDTNITLQEYTEHMSGDIHTVLSHIRDRKITPYVVFGIKDLGDIARGYPSDFLDFMAGKNFQERVDLYRSRYYNSRKAKAIIQKSIKHITKLITKKS